MTNIDAKTEALALKFRKGATAAFTLKDYEKVLGLIGWTVSATKEGRTVVSVTFSTPTGESFTEVKEPNYKAISFLDAPRFMSKHGAQDAVSALLGLHPYEQEQAKRGLYGVQYSVENAGLCPCCFHLQKLNADGTMVLHGYRRPGTGETVGRCWGVDLAPLEVSVEGTKALWSQVLEPNAQGAEDALASFLASPPTSITLNRNAGKWKAPEDMVSVDANTIPPGPNGLALKGYEYAQALKALEGKLKQAAKRARKTADAYGALVANWQPDMTPAERETQGKLPVMMPWIYDCM